jgi:RNA 2',3'-cyclic 3'-phosphodiesterase
VDEALEAGRQAGDRIEPGRQPSDRTDQAPTAPETAPALRLFLALPLPTDLAHRLHRDLAAVRALHPEVRFLRPEALHVTLVFIGWLDAALVPAVTEVAGEVASHHHPFDVRVVGAGGNPRRGRPGVAWLTIDHGARHITAIGDALARALAARGLLPREDRAAAGARPHLTVARRASIEVVADLQAAGPFGVAWRADAVTLFRSHLGREGSRYEAIAGLRLGLAGWTDTRDAT